MISVRLPDIAIAFLCLMTSGQVVAQTNEIPEPQKDHYVSSASFVIGTFQPNSNEHTPAAMVAACNKFRDSLNAEQREKVSHDLRSPERREWTNLPAPPNAGGIRFGELTEDQVKLACQLMANLFSEQGYQKIRDIMLADDQLLGTGQPRAGFGTENFSIVIFGDPTEEGSWAFQIDGHHVGINVSINGNQLTISPSFIGTQPEAFEIAGKKFEPFAGETGDAYTLVGSLNDAQIKEAVLRPQRARIVTGPGTDGKVPPAKGVSCETFTEAQKKLLLKLIGNWVNDLPAEHATKRMRQIESELDQTKFSWNGNKQPGSDISYAIQGPSLIIEYACQDLGGNPLAHLHSMYRDPTNEYAKQLE